MLGSAKTRVVRASATASSPRSLNAGLYRRYAAALYRQALLTDSDPEPAQRVVRDVIVNERALAAIPDGGEGNASHRRTGAVLRYCYQLVAAPAWRVRRAGQGRI
jgi:hypothetical protein